MAETKKVNPEKKEYNRLKKILKALPPNLLTVADGLIHEAARLRVILDECYADIEANGRTEPFSQSEKAEPYDRERPVVRQYFTANKAYQTTIKQLIDICPESKTKGKLEALMRDD